MRLRDTAIVVTGASSGLGKAMASAFVEEGASVVCASRSADRLSAAASGMTGEGDAVGVPTDVGDWDAVSDLVAETVERFGAVDVLVNNAGVLGAKVDEEGVERHVAEVRIDVWNAVLGTNLRGPFLCSKAALPGMLERGAGRLVHVSSGHGSSGRANRAPYVASKFGLEGFHESLALELEGTGVSSVALRPPSGGIYTERQGDLGRSPDEFRHPSPDVVRETAVRLAAGEGENGGRYQVTDDGEKYVEYRRA